MLWHNVIPAAFFLLMGDVPDSLDRGYPAIDIEVHGASARDRELPEPEWVLLWMPVKSS